MSILISNSCLLGVDVEIIFGVFEVIVLMGFVPLTILPDRDRTYAYWYKGLIY